MPPIPVRAHDPSVDAIDQWLVDAGRQIVDRLGNSLMTSGFSVAPLTRDEVYSTWNGGSCLIIARHRAPLLRVELWCDRWARADRYHPSLSFLSADEKVIGQLVGLSSALVGTPRDERAEEAEIYGVGVTRFSSRKHPIAQPQHGGPIWESGEHETFLTLYGAPLDSRARVSSATISRLCRFARVVVSRVPELSRSRKRVSQAPLPLELATKYAASEIQSNIDGVANRQLDPRRRRAVEQRAMVVARESLKGWTVTACHTRASYDFYCRKGRLRKRVEVKGTQGIGNSLSFTANEIELARTVKVDLIVVHSIVVRQTNKGPVASGGVILHEVNWRPAAANLQPTTYVWSRDVRDVSQIRARDPYRRSGG